MSPSGSPDRWPHSLWEVSADRGAGDSEHLADVGGADSLSIAFLARAAAAVYFTGPSAVAVVSRGRSEAGPGVFDLRVAHQLGKGGQSRQHRGSHVPGRVESFSDGTETCSSFPG